MPVYNTMFFFGIFSNFSAPWWFLSLRLLAANFSRWYLTSSSVPPVGWTLHSPTSHGLNISSSFTPSLAWTSRSPEWAQGHNASSIDGAWTKALSPFSATAKPFSAMASSRAACRTSMMQSVSLWYKIALTCTTYFTVLWELKCWPVTQQPWQLAG